MQNETIISVDKAKLIEKYKQHVKEQIGHILCEG
jgi:hypothetical protein